MIFKTAFCMPLVREKLLLARQFITKEPLHDRIMHARNERITLFKMRSANAELRRLRKLYRLRGYDRETEPLDARNTKYGYSPREKARMAMRNSEQNLMQNVADLHEDLGQLAGKNASRARYHYATAANIMLQSAKVPLYHSNQDEYNCNEKALKLIGKALRLGGKDNLLELLKYKLEERNRELHGKLCQPTFIPIVTGFQPGWKAPKTWENFVEV